MTSRAVSMKSWPMIAAGFALVAMLLILLMRPGGIGGTGINPREGGIGGTGIGTGYIGRIERFGSIFVNGEEIFFSAQTPVQFNTHTGTTSELQIGQIVEVLAQTAQDGSQQAVTMRVRHAVIGTVDATASDRITVLGKTILLPAEMQAPAKGDVVAISGFTTPTGMIVASRIDPALPTNIGSRAAPDRPFISTASKLSLSGYARADGDDIVLYGYKLSGQGALPPEGSIISVRGTVQADQLRVQSIEQKPAPVFQKIRAPIEEIKTAPPVQPKPEPIKIPVQPELTKVLPPTVDRPSVSRPERAAPPVRPEPRLPPTPRDTPVRTEKSDATRMEETTTSNEPAPPRTEQPAPEPVRVDDTTDKLRPIVPVVEQPPTRPVPVERPERPQTIDRPQRPERPERPQRPERPRR